MSDLGHRPLWQLSATELASAYRQGTATPDAVLAATLERLSAVDPRINAVITLDREGTLRAAQQSTERWRCGQSKGPLDGIPVTVKDNIFVGGLRATWGSRLYENHVPAADEEPVARLRAAGAVILGKTNVPEFTLHGYTDNLLFGPTRNPWDLTLTPGGSSGGAAAAVAAGIGPIALGTDGGGSIRRPAAYTGLVGFKPSTGLVPRGPGFPAILHDFEVIGPLVREPEDVAVVLDAVAGPLWQASAEEPLVGRQRILHITTFGDAPVDRTITHAVADAAAVFERGGYEVQRVHQFDLAKPIEAIWPVISASGLAWLLSDHEGAEHIIGAAVADIARSGSKYSAAAYVEALDVIRATKAQFDALFTEFDLLLMPATAAMPWLANKTHPPVIDGLAVGPRGHAVFTAFANALGLPAISLPCPPGGARLPIGFQLCAPRNADRTLLSVSLDYWRRAGMHFRWPPA